MRFSRLPAPWVSGFNVCVCGGMGFSEVLPSALHGGMGFSVGFNVCPFTVVWVFLRFSRLPAAVWIFGGFPACFRLAK
jgi:hypothetical protein